MKSKYHIEIPEKLYNEVKRGDNQKAINDAILLMLPMAERICKSYAIKYPYKADDIISTGMFALVKAVNNFHKSSNDNLVAFANLSIKGRIQNFLKEDHQIRVPRNVQDEGRKRGDYTPPEFVSRDSEDYVENGSYDPFDATVQLDFYEYCFSRMQLYPIEKKVLALLREGHVDRVIAGKLGIGKTKVHEIRHSLYERFNKLRYNSDIIERFFGR